MKKYSIIYADPPWRYKVYSKKGLGRSAESHYPTMELEDIRALPVGTLAADDCVLFLWTTIPLLHDCFSVMRAWGFSYKPEEARRRIVELMGDLPRIELFARQKTDGWDVWGNEVACDIALTGGEINVR